MFDFFILPQIISMRLLFDTGITINFVVKYLGFKMLYLREYYILR